MVMAGRRLDAGEAENLEAYLKCRPADLTARTELLGYCSRHDSRGKSARESKAKHVLLLIRNSPEAEVLGLPYGQFTPLLEPERDAQGKGAWLEQLKSEPESLPVLGDSAASFLLKDQELARVSLQKARALDMRNPKWPAALGQLYGLDMTKGAPEAKLAAATKALEQLEIAYELTTDAELRSLHLAYIAKATFAANKPDRAKQAAEKMLRDIDESDGAGHVTHHGNTILGRVALLAGNVGKAKEHLLRAGDIDGAPGLRTFGPNMALAKDLLEKGEKAVVLEYLKLCGEFWEMGEARLAEWTAAIRAGKAPDFGANLHY